MEEWYDKTENLTFLMQSNEVFKKSLSAWKSYYINNRDKAHGLNDGYQVSSINRLCLSFQKLFVATNDSAYLHESFNFAEQAKYNTFSDKKTSINEIQNLLDDSTAFVHITSVPRPGRNIVFIIFKSDVKLVETRATFLFPSFLYQFDNIKKFKRYSYITYQNYFEKIDSVLTTKNINNVIISNTDIASMLNLDVLITDTLSDTWKDQPYLFHKYNFSYSLSGKSFVKSYDKTAKNINQKEKNFKTIVIDLFSVAGEEEEFLELFTLSLNHKPFKFMLILRDRSTF